MNSSSPQSTPLAFEPDSIYLLFIMRTGRPCAGVFHHNSEHRGILAYADVGMPGPRRSHHKVFSFELERRIETEYTIVAAHKVASLHYHEWLPNENFASSEFVDENQWMTSVLRGLDTKWKRRKLVWTNHPETEPSEFKKLARLYVPSVLFLTQAFYIRQLESGDAGPRKRSWNE
ncbi:hypothetical protein BDM02DRAFT_3122952 [Thelephora ganbajun]|uniref:Uncharacterized protein n=1 Tax=Thelephora ganbajun TaxID=370292 RepID=A0ACB6Z2K2_THEGA|nr:hypothetical protein BDM02DRAFT_3122952 [Thelephora ganbajun]